MNTRRLSDADVRAALNAVQQGRLAALADLAMADVGAIERGALLKECVELAPGFSAGGGLVRHVVRRMVRQLGQRGAEVLLALLVAEVGGRVVEPGYKLIRTRRQQRWATTT